MAIPFRGLWMYAFRSWTPWAVFVVMLSYVAALHFYSTRRKAQPKFSFYSKSSVEVEILDTEEHAVYGTFNNVVEGQRKIVQPQNKSAENKYYLDFELNSPRPSILFIDDEQTALYLVPDSALKVKLGKKDSIIFEGYAAPICRYYQAQKRDLAHIQVGKSRSLLLSEDYASYVSVLDSLANVELDFLWQYQQIEALPDWFILAEQNEIRYQKAYLKLSNSENPAIEGDKIPLQNPKAVFSYNYYLYLNTWINGHYGLTGNPDSVLLRKIGIADSMLRGEVHDVFVTQHIFRCLQQKKQPLAEKILAKYPKFYEKRYERFLKKQLENTDVHAQKEKQHE